MFCWRCRNRNQTFALILMWGRVAHVSVCEPRITQLIICVGVFDDYKLYSVSQAIASFNLLLVVLATLGKTRRKRGETSTDKEILARVREEGKVKCEVVDDMDISPESGDML